MRKASLCLLAVLLCAPVFSRPAEDVAQRLQRAYFDTAKATLQDYQNDVDEPAAETESVPVAMPELRPFPEPHWYGIRNDAWDIALALAMLSLAVCAADGLRAWRRWWISPRQRSLRSAKRCLREFVAGGRSLEDAVAALRERLELAPGATLSQVALAVQDRSPRLADACRALELARWGRDGGWGGGAAVHAFKAALKPLLMLAVGMCLSACVGMSPRVTTAFSDWSHGQVLASDGRAAEALEVFFGLVPAMPSSPELSQNIAALLTVLPVPLDAAAMMSAPAWTLHGKIRREAFRPYGDGHWANALPEICLALVVPLAVIGILLACHRRLCTAAIAAALAVSAAVALGVTVQPRLKLPRQVVVAPGAVLWLTPDDDGLAVTTLQDAAQAELDGAYSPCNGFRRIRVGDARGWMAARQCLEFRLKP